MMMYIAYLYNIQGDVTSLTKISKISGFLIAFIVITALFLFVYLVFYSINLVRNCCRIRELELKDKFMFILSIVMLILCISTIGVGIYSPFYANGGAFVFFVGLFNIYVWVLVYLNWPTAFENLTLRE